MKQRVAALDIGGSGCRLAWVDVDPSGSHQLQQVHQLGSPGSLSALAAAVTDRLGPVSRLGISAAGFVDSPKGVVAHCRVQPWVEGNVVEVLQRKLGGTVTVVNDGEAHLLAHVAGTTAHPILCFAFGTSVGFGMTDEHGNVSRPRGNYNWELSSLRVPTRSSRPEVWWALGTNGLREAQESMGEHEGIKQFGWRIGGLLADFTALFRPRSIVLTGGIIETHGAVLVRGARSEMNRALPAEIDRPTVVSSPFGRQSALVGAAVAAALSA